MSQSSRTMLHSLIKLVISLIKLVICNTLNSYYFHVSGHRHHHQPKHPRPIQGETAKPNFYKERGQETARRPETVQVAGSSLPECSHACGSCSPCRLVMVSFICAAEAETCPMAYKCMCNSKSYPVP